MARRSSRTAHRSRDGPSSASPSAGPGRGLGAASALGRIPTVGVVVGISTAEVVGRSSRSFLSPQSGAVETLARVIEHMTGARPELSTGGGTSDARFIAQDHAADFADDMTLFDWMSQWVKPSDNEQSIRAVLGRMLFSRDESAKSVTVLSGGEQARMLFGKLIMLKPNILVLDEPTNHLDMESIEALNLALDNYPGTLVFVSHDLGSINQVCNRAVWLNEGQIQAEGKTAEITDLYVRSASSGPTRTDFAPEPEKPVQPPPPSYDQTCNAGGKAPLGQPRSRVLISQIWSCSRSAPHLAVADVAD